MRNAEYENRIVAFIDILGWRNLVEASANDTNLLSRLAASVSALNQEANLMGGFVGKHEAHGTTFVGRE